MFRKSLWLILLKTAIAMKFIQFESDRKSLEICPRASQDQTGDHEHLKTPKHSALRIGPGIVRDEDGAKVHSKHAETSCNSDRSLEWGNRILTLVRDFLYRGSKILHQRLYRHIF